MTYHIVWRYLVRPEHVDAFERAYGPDGRWARFFRDAEGYVRTELIVLEPGRRYMTIDTWDRESQYKRFAADRAEEYASMDRAFEAWTEHEEQLGAGETLG